MLKPTSHITARAKPVCVHTEKRLCEDRQKADTHLQGKERGFR